MKAFDSISHKSFWKAFEQCGIEPPYTSLLRRLKTEQKAAVFTDRESDVRDNEENVAGRPIVQFALQSPSGTKRRRDTLAKDRRQEHMLR